jgi:hypothetical protein
MLSVFRFVSVHFADWFQAEKTPWLVAVKLVLAGVLVSLDEESFEALFFQKGGRLVE